MPNLSSFPDLSTLLRTAVGRDAEQDAATWAIVDLHGGYPAHQGLALPSVLGRPESLESLVERLDQLAGMDSVRGVLVRVVNLTAGLATCEAISRALGRLQQGKRVVAYLPQVTMRSLLVAADVREVVAPESAEVMLTGFAAERVFYGEFLTRRGIGFENLRIREYKSALTRFSDDHMDDYEREQLTAYIDSVESSWLTAVTRDGTAASATGGGDTAGPSAPDPEPDVQQGSSGPDVLDAHFTNATQLLEAGLVTRIAYDDEIAVPADQGWARSLQFLAAQLAGKRRAKKEPGIAVVPVVGAIVSGRSRPGAPPFAGQTAGSETVVAALRKAERDENTWAILLHVDSGGGSALASDVICRAVARCTKPVVAVMGEVAASGGYYVLAQADHVVASPFTITGSIGVVVGKPVLAELNERIGRNPETVGRQMALFGSPNRPFTEPERAWAERMMDEVYERFVARVAEGRRLSPEQVNEIGRGRIWSGVDAHERGLVDELGDLQTGIAAARRLAGLSDDAPVRPVSAGFTLPGAPNFGKDPAAAVAAIALSAVWPFGQELVLTWFDSSVTIR
ncbi:signal peptide peptidase A. Serine peptidase. MEROPS family S49 [Raineyella antarctica]|uniref:Signal peptide peptidase A. Serine peptidase. MEROPS family S49 n=1 Tax=Raineyella antarctica TaxID=1577474 RepID=A0A1G6GCP9_9ACTN|nr:S49 family peptidase [Raineyella antarctica]SDB79758.1 signal peptide peptidase A. Serine peptidase. MEROPS family S49 [Raineyella antarctica]